MQKLFFVDTETTGTDKIKNGIIQIAGKIIFFENGVYLLKEKFNFTVRPFPNDIIEPKALEVNGKTKEEIMQYETPLTVYRKIILMLEKYCDKFNKTDKFTFVGYNSPFDFGIMWEWFVKCGDNYFGSWFWTPDICVMRMAADYIGEKRKLLPNFKLGTVAKYFNLAPEGNLHDAMTDIDVTVQIYLLVKVCNNNGRRIDDEIIDETDKEITFDKWFEELKKLAVEIYYYSNPDDIYPIDWKCYYEDGLTPEKALSIDASHAD